MSNGELMLYNNVDGGVSVQAQAADGTVWVTKLEMATLFQTTKQRVCLHVKNILADSELSEAVVKEYLTTAADGKKYKAKSYNKLRADVTEQLALERFETFGSARRKAAMVAADAEDMAPLDAMQQALESKGREKPK